MTLNPALSEPVAVIGAGPAGLISAHVLLQDGFTHVTILTRDATVGGIWARHRVYPGLFLNNVHGEYRFSALEMPLPERAGRTGGQLTGASLCKYMEDFAGRFLTRARFRFNTEVCDIRRAGDASSDGTATNSEWNVDVRTTQADGIVGEETLAFRRIVLATGGCSSIRIPEYLSTRAADEAGFKGLVFHTSAFQERHEELLQLVDPSPQDADDENTILVIGGGKSAQDISARLAGEGRRVSIIFDTTDDFLASPQPLAGWIRKSRLLSVLMAHDTLRTRLERFLHKTWLGSKIVHFLVKSLAESSYQAYKIPSDSPLRRGHGLFWNIRVSDEGTVRPDSYLSRAMRGGIDVVSPARVAGYSKEGTGVVLDDGRLRKAKAVILATGYESSWNSIFSEEQAGALGISSHAPAHELGDLWQYHSLKNGPTPPVSGERLDTSIYRGIVPAKNIERRDFAIAGANFNSNAGYINETAAHWISAYFQGDKMRLPRNAEEAMKATERYSAWKKIRYAQILSNANESNSAVLNLFTWPQAADELLEDMYLPSGRSGGNWLNWVFKTISVKELETLGEERRAMRSSSHN